MKNTVMTTLALITFTWGLAQKWEYFIGEPNRNDYSQRIIEHYDKGYVITCTFTSGYNDGHGWIIKTDINGNLLWDKTIGVDPDQVIIMKSLYDSQGNLYSFGTIDQEIDPFWPLAIKLNACGELQWCNQLYFEDNIKGQFYDAIKLDNGDLLALASMPNEDQHDMIYLFCISNEGEYKWRKSYASKDDYPLFEFRLGERIQFFDNIYVISGYTYAPHPNYPTISSTRPMFIGIDTLFNEQWVLVFGMEDNMKGQALTSIPINDSLLMGVGRHRYADTAGVETKDAWAMFYNKQGEQIGYTVLNNDKFNNEVSESAFYEIEKMNDSLFIANVGLYSVELDNYTKGVAIFDTTGNLYNYNIQLESSSSAFMTKTFDNKYTIATSYLYPDLTWDIYFYKINDSLEHDTVYPGNYTYDSLCTELPIQSSVIDISGCDVITSMEEIPTLEEFNNRKNSIVINAFPNPTSDGSVTLSFQNTEYFQNMELKCFDVFGKEVHTEKVYRHQGESEIDISQWMKGVYFVIVYSESKPIGECKFVVN